jgi:hypothetical protein
MLVAVTVTVDAVVPVAVRVVVGALLAALEGLTVPAPVAEKVAPEALESFISAAANVSVWPESSTTPLVVVVKETEMGARVTVAVAVLVVSFTLVAVMVAEVIEPTTAGAV